MASFLAMTIIYSLRRSAALLMEQGLYDDGAWSPDLPLPVVTLVETCGHAARSVGRPAQSWRGKVSTMMGHGLLTCPFQFPGRWRPAVTLRARSRRPTQSWIQPMMRHGLLTCPFQFPGRWRPAVMLRARSGDRRDLRTGAILLRPSPGQPTLRKVN